MRVLLSEALRVQEKEKIHQQIQEPSTAGIDTHIQAGHRQDMVSSDRRMGWEGQARSVPSPCQLAEYQVPHGRIFSRFHF